MKNLFAVLVFSLLVNLLVNHSVTGSDSGESASGSGSGASFSGASVSISGSENVFQDDGVTEVNNPDVAEFIIWDNEAEKDEAPKEGDLNPDPVVENVVFQDVPNFHAVHWDYDAQLIEAPVDEAPFDEAPLEDEAEFLLQYYNMENENYLSGDLRPRSWISFVRAEAEDDVPTPLNPSYTTSTFEEVVRTDINCECSNSLPHIPEDVIPNILSFLPTEDKIRCQVVCKSWRDIILPNLTLPEIQHHRRKRERELEMGQFLLGKMSPGHTILDYFNTQDCSDWPKFFANSLQFMVDKGNLDPAYWSFERILQIVTGLYSSK